MPSDVRAVFAESVTRERQARGWNRAQLARKAGVTETTLANIEHQRQGPSLQTVSLIAKALGLPVGALTDGEAGRE